MKISHPQTEFLKTVDKISMQYEHFLIQFELEKITDKTSLHFSDISTSGILIIHYPDLLCPEELSRGFYAKQSVCLWLAIEQYQVAIFLSWLLN